VEVVAGAASRSGSVAAVLERVDSELVAVHDAARPLAGPELFDAVLGELASDPDAAAVICAAPLTDTVKRAGGDRVVEATLDRSALWAAQTPQAFRTEALREALAGGDLAAATDDASLVEALGHRVLLHEAPAENVKVTTPADLRLAELLLAC
jgi:2-C-methyl-D-erythritol 4-phosphate cytidylyltransferase